MRVEKIILTKFLFFNYSRIQQDDTSDSNPNETLISARHLESLKFSFKCVLIFNDSEAECVPRCSKLYIEIFV